MRWRGQRESENVEDRRGEGGGFGFPFPGGVRFPSGGGGGGGGIGILGILILLGLMFFFGLDPRIIMQGGGPGGDEATFPDIRLPQERPDATNFPVPGQQRPPVERPQTTSEDDLKKLRVRRPRRYRGCLARSLRALRCGLQGSEARAVLRRRALGVRLGHGADGPVLLPDGREGLYRSRFLRGPQEPVQSARRLCPGLCHRA